MLESKLKTDQRKHFEKLGWVFVQFGNDAPTGFPDTICLAPNGYRCFVEWKKSKTSKKQPLQQYWHDKLNAMGQETWWVYPQNINEWRDRMLKNG
jgi:hypothetical protein